MRGARAASTLRAMIETIPPGELDGRVARDPRALSDALERGAIVYFPRAPIELPGEADLTFLRDELAAKLERKNVSWYFASDRLKGLPDAPEAGRAHALLREHAARVRALLEKSIPEFARGWTPGTTSFRPLQEKGRALSAHASNERVHVDAGAYGATHGDRILRFFVNVNPREDRVWVSKGAFPQLFAEHGRAAGVAGVASDPVVAEPDESSPADSPSGGSSSGESLIQKSSTKSINIGEQNNSLRRDPVREGPLDRAWTSLVRAGSRLSPALKMIDSSPYDRLMRRFHNWMKDSPDFRDSSKGLETFRFPPFSAWMVLTDQVSHACVEGQHALVDTFVIPLANCRLRELSPYEILRTGRAPELAP